MCGGRTRKARIRESLTGAFDIVRTLGLAFPDVEAKKLVEDAPETYYLTGYYRSYPLVLVRMSRVEPDALRDLLFVSWRMTRAKARSRRPPPQSRALRVERPLRQTIARIAYLLARSVPSRDREKL